MGKAQWGRFKGDIKIGEYSSLRKLMRAARRGKMPDERQAIIDLAVENAKERQSVYLNAHQRGMAALRKIIAA